MKILFVLTSHNKLGSTGEKTGFWLEEFAAPYYRFVDSGASVTLVSPAGGQPPLDPKSQLPEFQTEATRRFGQDQQSQEMLSSTGKLASVSADDFDAIFYPGGHGPLWDLVNDPDSIELIGHFCQQDKPVSAVCHAPAVLLNVTDQKGVSLVQGRKVTGFSNSEEIAVQLDNVVPFSLEDELKNRGALYSAGPDWESYLVQDGLLVTGQNPASSEAVADAVLSLLT
ncbi:type 1 glutamine amidotransferase domain-containing protein [Endozoicomonas sp. ONNA2]|uniref:type 1 glutamine amidotransferase domain-containing protein n=1 Tax=Endozoicomonas sp. ONNA2 TaxID=2828741 RepID=UPI0021491FF8|nr:type 1 glutamine amidotransferase domain-containing protein [Endozoicomonas sp. ONNA2]